jgi:REP element-mobilizing transposase RayT
MEILQHEQWEKLPQRFSNFELDVFQIMPNHMHGIIVLNESIVGATLAVAQKAGVNERAGVNPAPTNKTVGDIVGAYKSLVANECLEIFKSKNETMGKLWQRNFHEHIIRNEQSYQTISNYIINNPATWETDKFFIA